MYLQFIYYIRLIIESRLIFDKYFTPGNVDKFSFATLGWAIFRVYTVVSINCNLFIVVSVLKRGMHRVHYIWICHGKIIKYKNTDISVMDTLEHCYFHQ